MGSSHLPLGETFTFAFGPTRLTARVVEDDFPNSDWIVVETSIHKKRCLLRRYSIDAALAPGVITDVVPSN